MDVEPKYWTCIACVRDKHERCWGTWMDHLDNQPWKCDCWECQLAIWQTYMQEPKDDQQP